MTVAADGTGEKSEKRLSRDQRRERTAVAILAAARRLFAEHGYDRTTIRTVAAEVGVDPALVMQHFGAKERLFAAAVESTVDVSSLVHATTQELPAVALRHVFEGFEDVESRSSAEALLRNCLTHPEAMALLRDDVMGQTQAAVAATIGGDDAELRAAVLNACTLGITLARYLLEVPALADAGRDDLHRVLGPALQAIVTPVSEV
ncbi:transcriptional regulator, TetR family [Kribbella flavida DSM 17836]|uniref:Transcriptional regulator, TetR family n=2 Tax=Kribbella flavida TaxID=182640 RepID=D2PQT5_KRIFD|nr:transcriptional regulator, TetR family [Kribbella flavida DSM 17836]